jgi:putative flippase GtrA
MKEQAIRFVLVGLSCAGLFFVVNYVALKLSGSVLFALVVAYVLCFPAGYLLQRNFTFDAPIRQDHSVGVPRYFILHLAGFVFVYIGTLFLNRYIPEFPIVTSTLTTGMAGAVSFVISRAWVFYADNDVKS